MGIFADEEWGTLNEDDVNYQKKIDSRFKLFAQGSSSVECVHSNISSTLVRCEICDDANINFVYVLKNSAGHSIKCGTRCAKKQKVIEIKNLKQWKQHLEEQIQKEEDKIKELRSSKRRIIRKKSSANSSEQ